MFQVKDLQTRAAESLRENYLDAHVREEGANDHVVDTADDLLADVELVVTLDTLFIPFELLDIRLVGQNIRMRGKGSAQQGGEWRRGERWDKRAGTWISFAKEKTVFMAEITS